MESKVVLRSSKDRIRHAIFFELILLVICVPVFSLISGKPVEEMGALGVSLSLIAMVVNYIYNYAFDHALVWLGKSVQQRSTLMRIVHAVLFEAVLFGATVPLIMGFMGITFMQALVLDIGFMIFVPCYAFVYNIAYDKVYPMPLSKEVIVPTSR